MKRLSFLTFLALLFFLNSRGQNDSLRTKFIQRQPKTPVTQTTKPVSLQTSNQRALSTIPADLKFSNLTVSVSPGGQAGTYTLAISYTVKNEGGTAILTDNAIVQCFISNEDWLTDGQKDLRFTRFLREAGGRILSDIPGRGQKLSPGASIQNTVYLYNQAIPANPKPIFVAHVSTGEKEQDTSNNIAYTTIII